MAAYTEAMVTKMTVRAIRDLVAALQGLTDEGEASAEQAPAAPSASRSGAAALLRAWAKATEDERQEVLERIGVAAKIDEPWSRRPSHRPQDKAALIDPGRRTGTQARSPAQATNQRRCLAITRASA